MLFTWASNDQHRLPLMRGIMTSKNKPSRSPLLVLLHYITASLWPDRLKSSLRSVKRFYGRSNTTMSFFLVLFYVSCLISATKVSFSSLVATCSIPLGWGHCSHVQTRKK